MLAVLASTLAAKIILALPFQNSPARETIGQRHSHENSTPRVVYYVREHTTEFLRGTVVLTASAGREVSDFNELIVQLNGAGYKTIAVEAPGINGADMREAGNEYSSPLYVMTMPIFYALSDARIYDDPIHLIGHAYGNRVVRAYAGNNNVKSVILLAAGGNNEIDPKAEKALKNVFNPLASFRQRKKDIAYAFFADGNEIPDYWLRGWHTRTAILQGKAKGEKHTKIDWQAAGGKHMLVVQPAEDRIAPKEVAADYLKERYPDQVEVVVIENAGHALLPEQPEAVAEAVIDFLDHHSEE